MMIDDGGVVEDDKISRVVEDVMALSWRAPEIVEKSTIVVKGYLEVDFEDMQRIVR